MILHASRTMADDADLDQAMRLYRRGAEFSATGLWTS
jgi:hypothetical protein